MSRKYTVVRYVKAGEKFEVLVDPDKAFEFKMGKEMPIDEIIAMDIIYTDSKKGFKASREALLKAFGTDDVRKAIEIILKKGELLLTAEQRKKLVEEKKRQIITFISKHCVDPRTKLPHPPTRIEQALEEIGFPIDPFRDAEEQAREVIERLKAVLPISMEVFIVRAIVPPQHVGRCYGVVKNYGKILKEEWGTDGSWKVELEMPAGLYGPFLEKMGELTKGSAIITLVEGGS
ncbi:ribosome assembly factor SBDS [Candidatus Bathyarchaeota archaeon ex4484_135]|nr:MAG: ribosome assembly factor SBDS [Candidatus Bathyarchaeota archaeon ex4484_135]